VDESDQRSSDGSMDRRRFWRGLPRAGHITLYDRSWYGRVMVERVEGFAREEEWRRSYREINSFEEQLCEHGITLLKFWMHISREEQLRRFQEREQTPHKAHKITDEDWRNREKWDEYQAAVNEMVAKTSTSEAPWTLVAGDDKRLARVQVVRTFVEAFEKAGLDPNNPPKTWPEVGRRPPTIMLKVVVLPAPLGPSNPTISPGPKVRSSPSTTFRLP